MAICTLRYQVTYPLVQEALRAVRRQQRTRQFRRARWLRLVLLFAVGLLATTATIILTMAINADWVPHWFGSFHLSLGMYLPLLAVFAITLTYGAFRQRRWWKHNVHIKQPHTLIATEESVSESWSTIRIEVAWQDISLLQTANALVLVSPLGLLIVPTNASPPAELEIFQKLLTTKCPPPSQGFPLS